ncbi:hypothetical protein Nepgr_006134 [Nepenthes gracilis]|uniref:histone acetyltransferase n=1 Tax=Nepenthes gracilis TaxID=150966 RepID=A0AAD3S4Z2_NEPGR|nr:hypothetical protein Nepgr_006134 [Nepenthes gracilis]
MASVGNQFPQIGGGGLGLMSPSGFRFNLRHEDPCRGYVRTTIAKFLTQNSSGNYEQQIAELAADLENHLFTDAVCKEDYLNRESFYDRLQNLIQKKWLHSKFAQQEVFHCPSSFLPIATDALAPSANLLDPFPDNAMAIGTGCNVVGPDDVNQPQVFADVSLNSLSGSQTKYNKHGVAASSLGGQCAFGQTSTAHEQVMSDNYTPKEVFSYFKPVDSGRTFSQSISLYDSETSFESNHGSQHIADGTGLIMSTRKNCPLIDVPSLGWEKSKLETVGVSDGEFLNISSTTGKVPMVESQQLLPNLQFVKPFVEGESCSQFSLKHKDSRAIHPDASGNFPLHSVSNGSGQCSVLNNLSQNLVKEILCCYIRYNSCPSPVGKNLVSFLEYVHSKKCTGFKCRCEQYNSLLYHFDNCHSSDCDICSPALKLHLMDKAGSEIFRSGNIWMSYGRNHSWRGTSCAAKDYPTPAKRRKADTSSKNGLSCGFSPLIDHSLSPDGPLNLQQLSGSPVSSFSEATELKMEAVSVHTWNSASSKETRKMTINNPLRFHSEDMYNPSEEPSVDYKQMEMETASNKEVKDKFTENFGTMSLECSSILSEEQHIAETEGLNIRTKSGEIDPDITREFMEPLSASGPEMKSEKQNVKGVSLTEFFTAEEVKQHLWSLRQSASEEVFGNITSHSSNVNTCQLCALDKLAFQSMPIYCSACSARIKSHVTYYSMLDDSGAQLCFCSSCCKKSRGGNITFFGLSVPKSKLEMKKNDVITEESWVQCDKCEQWQHQICSLFNGKQDLRGQAEYICPKCYLEELETGDRMPLPQTAGFGASNLPRTVLSDHIEQRLFGRLQQERADRAKTLGKNPDEVSEAADLVVRVVSSVDKEVKVKQQFLDIFPDKSYPAEFPYRSKVILLFQKIEGIDVCLFGMYVQEFGSQCGRPNQRCVYISYLDSVKYFRPETKTVTAEALRTFVYHEILIGYLDYCKKRGFATCYIWACPPVKGEDYILYCHPEAQKTPKPDKLRHWYQSMLRKAAKEQIVVNSTNLYEQFFIPSGECNTKVTAARLPYFDGAYWSTVVEGMLKKIEQECKGDLQKKVQKITLRSLKAMGHINPSAHDAKDILLMQELGQNISSAKEDFIIVYLQFVCTHCHEVILSGRRWFCDQCRNFQLCERCCDTTQNCEQANTHTASNGQKHPLSQEVVNDVPANTEDNDAILDNCFLENRHAFLSFCQGNHYQFDTLRHAKHSSMMILYHLHHPDGATVKATCGLCMMDIVVDPKWTCEICPRFTICAECYQKSGATCHAHNLTQYPTHHKTEYKKSEMERELLNVVLHASQCRLTTSQPCSNKNCLPMRRLFAHAHACKVRVSGGCRHCKKTWYVLMMHSGICTDSNCGVPRCTDLKKYSERLESARKMDVIPGD